MNPEHSSTSPLFRQGALPRRHFLGALAGSFSGLALSDLLARDGVLSGTLHRPPRAKRVVQLFMAGAASHIDLFDHKPLLESVRS